MHEFGLCQAILDAVQRRARGRPVLRVRVRAGALQHLTQDNVEGAFSLLAAGTEAQGAEIELVVVPADLQCRSCGDSVAVDHPVMVCPACHSDAIVITGGQEVTLESIEVAIPESSQVEGS